jgi:hypothetical protein
MGDLACFRPVLKGLIVANLTNYCLDVAVFVAVMSTLGMKA